MVAREVASERRIPELGNWRGGGGGKGTRVCGFEETSKLFLKVETDSSAQRYRDSSEAH